MIITDCGFFEQRKRYVSPLFIIDMHGMTIHRTAMHSARNGSLLCKPPIAFHEEDNDPLLNGEMDTDFPYVSPMSDGIGLPSRCLRKLMSPLIMSFTLRLTSIVK